MTMRPPDHIYICTKAMGPTGRIQWKYRADIRLDLSQNNKLNIETYAYGYEIEDI